jgi:hypothetical protein
MLDSLQKDLQMVARQQRFRDQQFRVGIGREPAQRWIVHQL